jgi:hypothetical protein
VNDNGRFLIDNRPVEESRISALLEVVREPREQKPSLVDLGIDAQWLSTNAGEALKDAFRGRYDSNGRPVTVLDSDQKARFLALFTDPEVMNEIFRVRLIEGQDTDDYPEVEFELGLRDKSTIVIHSKSASLLLLPWRIQGQEPKKFFDHRLSLALVSLLPHDAPNASRLAGHGLNGGFLSVRYELANGLARWIQLGCFKGDFNLGCD